MTSIEVGKFRKYLAIGEQSCLVDGSVRRDEAEEKASTK